MIRIGSLILVGLISSFSGISVCCATGQDSLHLNDFGKVEDFTFIDQTGREVSRDDLKGKVWIASFFYSTCPLCPSKHMPNLARIHNKLKNQSDVVIVSFSVNPQVDSPEKLAQFAEAHSAQKDRWIFLTGDINETYHLIQNSFKQSVGVSQDYWELVGLGFSPLGQGTLSTSLALGTYADVEETQQQSEIFHTFRFVVVDHHGKIRGYVDGTDAEETDRLVQRVRQLIQEKYFPTINASLNGLSGLLILLGYLAIRKRWITFHKTCMLLALGVSAVFLGCYLYYHIVVMEGRPTRFTGEGFVRVVYFAILLSHTVLAAIVAPLALFTAYLGIRNKLNRHVSVARWTLPLWLYVSVTGVLVYWMLYHLYPPG